MIVDYERAWLELKAALMEKNSHGQRDLLMRMAQIEVDCRVPEGERGFDPSPLSKQPSTTRLRVAERHG